MPIDNPRPVMGENLKYLDTLEVDSNALSRLASGDPAWAGAESSGPPHAGAGFLMTPASAFPVLVCMARELMRARRTLAELAGSLNPGIPHVCPEVSR